MKIAWLCPYPVETLATSGLKFRREKRGGHPCSWIVNLSNALGTRSDAELHIVTLSAHVENDQVCRMDNGIIVHVIKDAVPLTNRGWPAWLPLNAATGFYTQRCKLVKKLREIGPDIVHAHGTEAAFAWAAMDSGIPFVTSIQGIIDEYWKTNPCVQFWFTKKYERKVVTKSRYFMCRTHFDTGFIHRVNPEGKVFDIAEAMNPVFFDKPAWEIRGNRVLFVGSCEPRKGLKELIDAVSLVSKKNSDVVLDAVGGGSEEQKGTLLEHARSQGVELVFHGFMQAEQIARLHRECKMFVIPSENENSPNTLAEAMVSGMPVVAYNVGGVSSMFDDGESGLLVEPHDVEGLSSAMIRILADKSLREKLSGHAHSLGQRNWPDSVAEETIKAYKQILDKTRD